MPIYSGATDIADDEAQASDVIYAAEAENYNFIEVQLNPKIKLQNPRMAGVLEIKHFIEEYDENNMPKYGFHVQGGYLDFQFHKKKRRYIAVMLDDTNKGTVSRVGYNRDFLASHYERGYFIIPSKEVEEDIKKRALLIRKAVEKRELKAPAAPDNLRRAIKDKEEEVRRASEHLDLLKKQKNREEDRKEPIDIPEPENLNPLPADAKLAKQPKTEKEKKQFGQNMKAAREAKKREREEAAKMETAKQEKEKEETVDA